VTLDERARLLGLSCRDVVRGGCAWLTDSLVSTQHARKRLRRWIAAGRPAADPGGICIIGAGGSADVIQAAARRLPAPVLWHTCRNVITLLVGRELAGICSRLPALRRSHETPFIVAIDGGRDDAALQAVWAHETGHAWLSRAPSRALGRVTTLGEARSHEMVRAATPAAEWFNCAEAEERALDEWRVAALCQQWGFRGAAGDVTQYAADLRRVRALRAAHRRRHETDHQDRPARHADRAR